MRRSCWFHHLPNFSSLRNLTPVLDNLVQMIQDEDSVSIFLPTIIMCICTFTVYFWSFFHCVNLLHKIWSQSCTDTSNILGLVFFQIVIWINLQHVGEHFLRIVLGPVVVEKYSSLDVCNLVTLGPNYAALSA